VGGSGILFGGKGAARRGKGGPDYPSQTSSEIHVNPIKTEISGARKKKRVKRCPDGKSEYKRPLYKGRKNPHISNW